MTVQKAIDWLKVASAPFHNKDKRTEAIKCMKELEQYRVLGTVEELKEAREKQISIGLVLDLAWRYGQIDGAHHKMWVIDQMVRALCGSEEEYKKWVSKHTDDDYDWDCGIAP